ncbi:MAG: hypothetical protein PHE94_05690, partial [Eubacteriales bacterium]|nr:hypothetical protein [Eubacteriales bacterium]
MISLDLFDYSERNTLDLSITKYVNENLEIIIRVLLDYLNDDPDFELDSFFPRDYLLRKPDECRRLVDELYDIVSSSVLRNYIKPKYEYLLYTVLQWWSDCCDDESDLIPKQLPVALREQILNEP